MVQVRGFGTRGWRLLRRGHRPDAGHRKTLEGIVIDDACRVTDQSALNIVYQLMREEGIFVGLSSGINAAGALRMAREGGPGQVIVTLLCDSGIRYLSKTFNPGWLRAHGLDPNQPVS